MLSQPQWRMRIRYALVGTVILLAGCGNEPPAPGENLPELECKMLGYPCSLAETPLAILQRSEALSDQASAMLAGGTPMADVLSFLRGQPDVVDAVASDWALRFRVEGGRDAWILKREALAIGAQGDPDAQKVAKSAAASAADKPAVRTQHVVGDDDPDIKTALVLSPFKYEFGTTDDGAPVAAILEGTRGYAGNVTYMENPTKTAGQVGISQFFGWEEFDVVHISSHGGTVCDQTRCSAIILTGDLYSTAEDLLLITEAGVTTARVAGDDTRQFALSDDFFLAQYPNGLPNTLVFFNGCQTYGQDSGLGDAFIRNGGVFVGWSDIVQSDAALTAATAFYRKMSDHGVTAYQAWDELDSLSINSHVFEGIPREAILLVNRDGDRDLRLREVVRLEDPVNGGVLVDGATITVEGRANDGIVDNIPYTVFVEGIREDQQELATVQVIVEGFSSTPQTVSAGQRVGETGWRLSGSFPYIDVDLSQTVRMEARVMLPEGGVSHQVLFVTLVAEPAEVGGDPSSSPGGDGGGGQGKPEVWTGEATMTLNTILGNESTITLHVQVVFEQTSFSIGRPTKRLQVVGGVASWTRSGTAGLKNNPCYYTTGPIEFPVEARDGEILIDVATGRYWMHASSNGPEVTAAENCGQWAFGTSAQGVWLPPMSQDESPFVTDGSVITGTYSETDQSWTWSFTRQE